MKITSLNGKTPDIAEENIRKLKQIFPDVFTEDKVDFEKLQQVLGNYVEDNTERYNFTWNGKGRALRLSQTPSLGTLRPCKEESKDWDTTQNLYIEGDNLEVLKLLQKSYHGKVKMIYIDPPYNTGNDFVYPDDFHDSIENYKKITGQVDGNGRPISSNTESSGRYHTNWLNMMYPRLRLARSLLTDDGVIFISIDNNEVHNLRKVCDEVFGEDSFVSNIFVEMSATQGMKVKAAKEGNIVKNGEYILSYSKNGRKNIGMAPLYDYRENYDTHYSKIIINEKPENLIDIYLSSNRKYLKEYNDLKENHGGVGLDRLYKYSELFKKFVEDNRESIFRFDKVTGFNNDVIEEGIIKKVERDGRYYLLFNNGKSVEQLLLLSESFGICDDFDNSFGLRKIRGDWWKDFYKDMGNVSKEGNIKFINGKKPVRLILQLAKFITTKNDIILDFFSGSATTAHAVMQLNAEDGGNRKFIMVQLPEPTEEKDEAYKAGYKNICEIGKERIRRAREKIKEENKDKENIENLDIGFKVLKLDTSNIRKWQPDYDNLEQSLLDYTDNYVEDRTELDVVYEIMLKYGLDLIYTVDEFIIANKKVYSIGFGMLMICLDNEITTDVAKGMLEKVKKLAPESTRVVFKDNGFKTDSNKTNIKEILKSGGIEEFITL